MMNTRGKSIDCGQFLSDVWHFAECLPDSGHVINLVADRYLFLVSFCAVLLRGACNVLPPNAQPRVHGEIARGLDAACIVHDGAQLAPGIPAVEVVLPQRAPARTDIPGIESSRMACISYTSGSSGQSSAIPKSWGMLINGAAVNRKFLLDEPDIPTSLLATVPSQHMYGLETCILLPLVTDLCVHSGRPVFPADVAEALEALAEPRVLVSSPLHLRALAESGVAFPPLERVISATAPMSAQLARRIEQQLRTRLVDIYGCSEVGCLARREVARTENWQPFDAFRFEQDSKGFTLVNADHMDQAVQLQDRLEFDGCGQFQLTGRLGDQVKVGGKRASLGDLTRLLLNAPGVADGQVFEAPGEKLNQRLAAVYSGSASPREVLAHMRDNIDPVLLPRPLIHLESLPRNETGKLPREALIALYRAHRKS